MGAVPPEVSFVGRVVDLWGFLLGDWRVGHRVHDSVLVARPAHVHDVPSETGGIVQGESGFAVLLTETRWRNPFQLPGVEPIGPDIVLEPVSAHLGRAAPRQAPTVTWWPWHDGLETTDEFWSCANFALSLTTPNKDDRSILERVAEIGVVPGMPWHASTYPEEILEAIQEGMDDALSDLLLVAATGTDAAELDVFGRAEMDRDYFRRALVSLRLSHQLGR